MIICGDVVVAFSEVEGKPAVFGLSIVDDAGNVEVANERREGVDVEGVAGE